MYYDNYDEEPIYGKGYIPSKKDIRDYRLNKVYHAVPLPDSFEVEHSRIKNQGAVGSCVAHSVSEVLEALEDRNKEYSTSWIYGYRPTGYWQGTGMVTSDALKTVNKVGSLTEETLPGNYEMPDAKQLVKRHLSVYKEEAGKDKVVAYAKLRTIQEIKEAIYMTKKPIVICILCSDLKLDENYIAYIPDGATGGHAVVCYGWNEIGLLIQNSWGENWGNKGCFILPYEHPFSEAWVLTKDPNIAIKPNAFALREFIVNLFKVIATFIKGLFKKR